MGTHTHIVAVSIIAVTFACSPAFAQNDTVTTRSESGKTAKRRGTIVDWKGGSLSIQSGSRTRGIDNEKIVRVQTNWHESFEKGKQLLSQGKTDDAVKQFRISLSDEQRSWAQNIIRLELVRSYSASEQHAEAIQEFVRILATDPQTRFMAFAPLPWTGSIGNTAVKDLATKLIASREPVAQLIGASWLIGGAERAKSLKLLEQLAADFEPEIAHLAATQLWRAETGVANQNKLDKWKQRISQMPSTLRAGPYFVLATAQSRSNLVNEAALSWMRIPILHPEHNQLCAAALYKCGKLLHNDGQIEQARLLWTELMGKHPGSMWAQQIDQSQLQLNKE